MFCYLSNTSTKYFKAANNFGVFAILSDYGLMYLTRNLRTISVVQETDSDDVDQLHGIGTFLFFLWFDWLGAFALIIWARTVADVVKVGKIPNLNTCLVVFQQIAMWWSAPILSQHMQLDDRKLVLTRASPKFTYFVMLLSFTYLLFKSCEIKTREYLSIVIAGIAAASLHHAAFVDAFRVASNHADNDLMFDPLVEMMTNKNVEMFAESIPGCVLQCFVLLENPELISVGAVASLLISASTTG